MLRRDGARSALRPLRLLTGVLAAITALVTLSGCSLLGDRSDASGPTRNGLEKSRVVVGVLPVIDLAPLHLAKKEGYFDAEGLDVELQVTPSGPEALNKMIGGDLDIAFSSYPAFIAAQAKKVAEVRIVAESYAAKENTMMLMAGRDSPIHNPREVSGRRVAVTSTGSISDLSVKSAVKTLGGKPETIQFVPMAFPQMEAALDRGDVDAALLVEPFITKASKNIGARPVLDAASGPTAELPLAGYGATAEFVAKNPKTVAAFQRALLRAQREAEQDRTKVEALLPEYAGIDKETASLLKLGSFPSSLEPTRLQRVPDLLNAFGVIDQRINVKDMIVPLPH
ncbi:ABC transporter substrate-binding protein [Longimycelium tulufanense]|nr:ABC transporter substrate-binding protein [Longimycelium tulufanense]